MSVKKPDLESDEGKAAEALMSVHRAAMSSTSDFTPPTPATVAAAETTTSTGRGRICWSYVLTFKA